MHLRECLVGRGGISCIEGVRFLWAERLLEFAVLRALEEVVLDILEKRSEIPRVSDDPWISFS